MKKQLIEKVEVLRVIKDLFTQEHKTLKAHPINEQNIIGSKLLVIEIELRKLIKNLPILIDVGQEGIEAGLDLKEANQIKK